MNIMKAVLTLVLVLFLGVVATAQNFKSNDKVDSIKMDIVLVTGNDIDITFEKVTITSEESVVRLYRYKNSRVKSALAFRTKKDSTKMA